MRVYYYFNILRTLPPEMRKKAIQHFKTIESSGLDDPLAIAAAVFRSTKDTTLRTSLEELFNSEIRRQGSVLPL